MNELCLKINHRLMEKKLELEEILKEDPFFVNDVAKYEIIEFEATKYLDEFKQILNL